MRDSELLAEYEGMIRRHEETIQRLTDRYAERVSENDRFRNALIMIAKDRLSDRFKTAPDSDYPSRERLAQALLGIYAIADKALKDR